MRIKIGRIISKEYDMRNFVTNIMGLFAVFVIFLTEHWKIVLPILLWEIAYIKFFSFYYRHGVATIKAIIKD